MKKKLETLLEIASIKISEKQIDQLVSYVFMLEKWNKAYNLTSVRQPDEMLVRHILDSLVIEPFLDGNRFIDVGTGPGLPGIPLAVLRPEANFVLLDSLGKRIRFLRQVQHELGLDNVEPIQSRVEAFQATPQFDGVISRAFASLREMIDWCHHLINKQNGHFYALKGIYPESELTDLSKNVVIDKIIQLDVPTLNAERHLVVLSMLK